MRPVVARDTVTCHAVGARAPSDLSRSTLCERPITPWYAWTPRDGEFWVARLLLQRGLALTYLIPFIVAARQFRPLAGEDGLLPLAQYVVRYEFTTLAELSETGQWWTRERVSTCYPVSFDDSRFRLQLRRRGWGVSKPEREKVKRQDAVVRITESE